MSASVGSRGTDSTAVAGALMLCAALMFSGCGGDDDGGGDNNNPGNNGGGGDTNFTDSRDGKTYKMVTIGMQTWMAENLNYDASGSVCYDNNSSNCNTYGRLYDWATAMGLPSSCNENECASQVQSKHQGICPSGWHVPSDAEWETLVKYVDPNATGDDNNAGTKLKSTTGWNNNSSGNRDNGTDDFGFSALPSGAGRVLPDGTFDFSGDMGIWWSATEGVATGVFTRSIYNEYVDRDGLIKALLLSVRCLKD